MGTKSFLLLGSSIGRGETVLIHDYRHDGEWAPCRGGHILPTLIKAALSRVLE